MPMARVKVEIVEEFENVPDVLKFHGHLNIDFEISEQEGIELRWAGRKTCSNTGGAIGKTALSLSGTKTDASGCGTSA